MIKISPSVLAADLSNLAGAVVELEKAGAEMAHLDVMDGMFVPNMSFGMPVIEAMRNKSPITFDVHLMINEPVRYLADYKKAGADGITVHLEACSDVRATLLAIKELGVKCGLSIKPATPVSALIPYIELCDTVLIMTVEPGFGGQKLIPETVGKIKEVSELCKAKGLDVEIEADGGITPDNIAPLVANGLTVAVAGSAVFKAEKPAEAIAGLKGNK
jgi:ribulose-phosphate 3-epimerase